MPCPRLSVSRTGPTRVSSANASPNMVAAPHDEDQTARRGRDHAPFDDVDTPAPMVLRAPARANIPRRSAEATDQPLVGASRATGFTRMFSLQRP